MGSVGGGRRKQKCPNFSYGVGLYGDGGVVSVIGGVRL